jgi:hypothetical protein
MGDAAQSRGVVDAPWRKTTKVGRRTRLVASRMLFSALLLTTTVAGALLGLRYAPAAEVEIAGQDVTVEPVLGQDTTRLLDDALIRPEHAHVAAINRDIGVKVDADWNRLIPSDKQTRRYLTSLWEDPQPQIERLKSAARRHVIVWTLAGAAVGLSVVTAVWLGLGLRRRRLESYDPEAARIVTAHNRLLRVFAAFSGAGLLIVVHVLALSAYLHEDHHDVVGSPVFAGTSLEGTEASGLVAEILPLLSILQPRTTFYDGVSAELENELEARPELSRTGDEVVFLLAEDFEDVNGMARQVGLAADLVDASFIALSGDLTFAGKAVETYLIDTVDYYSGSRPVYLAPGLHDTPVVLRAAEARDWHVADGEVQEIEGLTLLPFADPRVSTVGGFGTDDLLRDPDLDVDQFVDEAIESTCEERPDFVLLHDHRLGRRIAESGCVEHAVLDGRSFTLLGPQVIPTSAGDTTIQYTGGSSGGHVDTRPDPGPVRSTATFTIFAFDPESDETSYAVVAVEPDGSVTVLPERPITEPLGSTHP